jgi:dephospho-CoA kinase
MKKWRCEEKRMYEENKHNYFDDFVVAVHATRKTRMCRLEEVILIAINLLF